MIAKQKDGVFDRDQMRFRRLLTPGHPNQPTDSNSLSPCSASGATSGGNVTMILIG
jgi:hypothetical protein